MIQLLVSTAMTAITSGAFYGIHRLLRREDMPLQLVRRQQVAW